MKIYLAYRFTGEDPKVLSRELSAISENLRQAGHDVFCSFEKEKYYRDNNFGNKEIINYTMPELDSSDVLLAYIKTPEKSEGMLIEIGYALGKGKRLIVAIKDGVKTNFVTDLAEQVINFDGFSDLEAKLKEVK